MKAGADGITAHLREDRRHISDADIERLVRDIERPLNLEMAAAPEMLEIALRHKPHACCLVPEKRTEVTTEGGLDVVRLFDQLRPYVEKLGGADIRVSLFIEADRRQLEAAKRLGAPVVELHTGSYCEAEKPARGAQLRRIIDAAASAEALGLECHAGHGLGFDTVGAVAAIPTIVESAKRKGQKCQTHGDLMNAATAVWQTPGGETKAAAAPTHHSRGLSRDAVLSARRPS